MNGVNVYRTDEDGTIIATSDGTNITFNVPASESWKAGEQTGSSSAEVQSQTQSKIKETTQAIEESQQQPTVSEPVVNGITYVLNKNTGKFHIPSCSSVDTIKDKNREDTTKSRDEIIGMGYVPCKRCNP